MRTLSERFRGGLAFEAHRLLYHPTLGLRVIKKKDLEFALLDDDAREEHPLDCLIYARIWP